MPLPIDKARKMVAIWSGDAILLRQMSTSTGMTQVELLHAALERLAVVIQDAVGELADKEEATHAG